jgi:T5SS/PEP-CTERM-associated repeat protein
MDATSASPVLNVTGSEYLGTATSGGLGGAKGTFVQSAGAHAIAGSLYIGNGAGATGSFTLSGTGQLNVAGSEYVGEFGAGAFVQQGGTHRVAAGGTIGVSSAPSGGGGVGSVTGFGFVSGQLYIADGAGSTGSYTLAGGTLITPLITNHGSFNQPIGGGTLSVAGSFSNTGSVTLGGTQQWGVGAAFVNTAGTALFQSDAGSPTASNLFVNVSGGSVSLTVTQHLQSLSVSSTGSVSAASVAPSLLVLNTSTLNFPGGAGTLDLTTNELLAQAAASSVRTFITTGRIVSSNSNAIRGLGYKDLGGGVTEVRYTLRGDATLDGTVDVGDLGALATNYGLTTGGIWAGGDFNYDGKVDVGDLGLLATNYGASLGIGPAAEPASTVASSGSVPEPAAAALVATGLCLIRRRNRSARPDKP